MTTISRVLAAWIAEGQRMRDERLAQWQTVRQEAQRRGRRAMERGVRTLIPPDDAKPPALRFTCPYCRTTFPETVWTEPGACRFTCIQEPAPTERSVGEERDG